MNSLSANSNATQSAGRVDPVLAGALCAECGLCCNGVLFNDVRLRPDDNPERLKIAGLRVARAGKSWKFRQPCSAHDGRSCRIYPDRPVCCLQFECGVLKRIGDGMLSAEQGRELIGKAKEQVREVERLLAELGDTTTGLSIQERFRRVMTQPLDLAESGKAQKTHGQLMRQMEKLARLLARHFRK